MARYSAGSGTGVRVKNSAQSGIERLARVHEENAVENSMP